MSKAHGTFTSLLFVSALLLGAAGTAGCDAMDEATDARTVPGENCVIDCDPVPQPGPDECVMTHDRWVARSFAAGPEQGPSTMLDGELCGISYGDILTAPRDTPWMKVAQQYVTARANVANGAAMPDQIAAAMDEAESFLVGCVPCPLVPAATRPAMKDLAAYNAGLIGPEECECVVDCGECIIDCDGDDDLDLCPVKELDLRAN